MLDRTSVALSPAVGGYADPLFGASTPIAYEQPVASIIDPMGGSVPLVQDVAPMVDPYVQAVAPLQQTYAIQPQMQAPMPAPMPSQPMVTPIYDDDVNGGRSLYSTPVNYQAQRRALLSTPLIGSYSPYGVAANPLISSRLGNPALGAGLVANPYLAGNALVNPALGTPLLGNNLVGNGLGAGVNGLGNQLANGIGNGVNAVGNGLNAVGNGIVDGANAVGNAVGNAIA